MLVLLERLRLGTLEVDGDKGCLYTWINGTTKLKRKRQLAWFKGGRTNKYKFVRVQYNGKREAYSLQKAIFIACNLKPVPKNYDVDHIDKDTHNNSIHNLRLLHYKKNRSTNRNGKTDQNSEYEYEF